MFSLFLIILKVSKFAAFLCASFDVGQVDKFWVRSGEAEAAQTTFSYHFKVNGSFLHTKPKAKNAEKRKRVPSLFKIY